MAATALPIFSLALTSCEAEDSETIPQTELMAREASFPDNPANPYDAAGRLYTDITEAYILNGTTVGTTAGAIAITESLAESNTDYLAIKPGSYLSPTAMRIDYIATHGKFATDEAIATAGLTIKAGQSLTAFLDDLMDYDAATDYGILYDYIVKYETSVLTDPMLTSYDQRILLTTSSIARHGFYLKKKKRPRDRDWDISWGNITGGIEGSTEDMAKAVVMAVSAGIVLNE